MAGTREGRGPAARVGGNNSAALQACWRVELCLCGIKKWNTVRLLRISEETEAASGFDMFARAVWEWWAGEKKKRASSGVATCFAPRSVEFSRWPDTQILTLISKIYRSLDVQPRSFCYSRTACAAASGRKYLTRGARGCRGLLSKNMPRC